MEIGINRSVAQCRERPRSCYGACVRRPLKDLCSWKEEELPGIIESAVECEGAVQRARCMGCESTMIAQSRGATDGKFRLCLAARGAKDYPYINGTAAPFKATCRIGDSKFT